MKILFVIPDSSYSGAAKQLALIAPGMSRARFEVRVCVLGRGGPVVAELRAAELDVEVLGWTRLIDPRAVWRLRHLIQAFQPDLLAGWGESILRWGGLVKGRARLILSQPLPLPERAGRTSLLNQWLLRRSDRVIAGHQAEVRAYQRLGMPAERIRLIPPGVAPVVTRPDVRAELFQALKLPVTARLVVCVGPLLAHKGYRDALWAFDILKYLYDDLHLVIVGAGPDRERLEAFAGDIAVLDRAHFLGWQPDASAWLTQAEVVWVLSRAAGGINVALEAMSAGRPVVACRTPGLVEVIGAEETGALAAPGDKAAVARQTRLLLEDAGLRQRLGTAAQRRAAERFAVVDLVQHWIRLAEGL